MGTLSRAMLILILCLTYLRRVDSSTTDLWTGLFQIPGVWLIIVIIIIIIIIIIIS